MDPIRERLARTEAHHACMGIKQTARSLHTICDYMPEGDPLRAVLRRRADQLVDQAVAMVKAIEEALKS
jgi:hypothetical protein